MGTQRIIIRTCDACAGTKKDRSDLPRYQWFFLIGVLWASFGTIVRPDDVIISGGVIICIASAILIIRSLKKGCSICGGRGRRRILESIHESTNDEAPFVDEIPQAEGDDR